MLPNWLGTVTQQAIQLDCYFTIILPTHIPIFHYLPSGIAFVFDPIMTQKNPMLVLHPGALLLACLAVVLHCKSRQHTGPRDRIYPRSNHGDQKAACSPDMKIEKYTNVHNLKQKQKENSSQWYCCRHKELSTSGLWNSLLLMITKKFRSLALGLYSLGRPRNLLSLGLPHSDLCILSQFTTSLHALSFTVLWIATTVPISALCGSHP